MGCFLIVFAAGCVGLSVGLILGYFISRRSASTKS